jgi:uncharacterized DUF497 family protein
MEINYDPAKNRRNIADRGISFDQARDFDWSGAWVIEDTRKNYGEPRFQALGLIEGRLHMLVFTPRGDRIHVISMRRANTRETGRYEKQNNSNTN